MNDAVRCFHVLADDLCLPVNGYRFLCSILSQTRPLPGVCLEAVAQVRPNARHVDGALEDMVVEKLQRRQVRPTNGTLQYRPAPLKLITRSKLLGLPTSICAVLTAKLTRLTPTLRVGDPSEQGLPAKQHWFA